MSDTDGVAIARNTFESRRERLVGLAASFVDDPEQVVAEASERYESMIPTMAYVDNPDAPMAGALFGCSSSLALYLTLQTRGIDAHEYGRVMLEHMVASAPSWPEPDPDGDDWMERNKEAGEASKRERRPGEFVFDVVEGESGGEGMNILSCAICYQFSRYEAMDLVPYMCATDDVVSDRYSQGLRRTGTIAVGAHHCDFRYEKDGEPKHLADQYPDKIRIPVSPA